MFEVEGFLTVLFVLVVLALLVLLGAAGWVLALLLAAGIRFALWRAAGLEVASSGLVVSGVCGPVSTGPDGSMELTSTGEFASGSGSSVIETPFPFLLVVNGVTRSRLAELLVLRVLFR